MYTIKNLRKQQYDYHKEKFPYLFDFIRNPYSFIKAKFYMESSAVLVWLLLKTKIKPNTVTIIYDLTGIFIGILLAIPNRYTICIALIMAFTKGILDWSDGHFARITGQTSLKGSILDIYGAHLNSLGFQIGLGLYVAYRADTLIFYYLLPLLLFFRAGSLTIFSKAILFEEISSEINFSLFQDIEKYDNNKDNNILNKSLSSNKKFINIFSGFLDDRARSVDFICLIILLEMVSPINISWLIFLLLVVKFSVIFIGSFFIVVKGNWVENKMTIKQNKLYDLFLKKYFYNSRNR